MANSGSPPRVAVIAIISDDQGRVVAGRRLGTLGPRQWSFPGGHLEYGEDFFACAERETLEETGLVIKGVKIIAVTNDKFTEDNKHYITLFAKCVRVDSTQQPERLEPNKCEGWTWKSWGDIKAMMKTDDGPQQLFLPVENLLRENPEIESLVTIN